MRLKQGLATKVFLHAILVFVALMALYPIFIMVAGSFKSAAELAYNASGLPIHPTGDNYRRLVDYNSGVIVRTYFNSLFIATSYTLLTLIVASMAAFAFAKFQFWGRNQLFILVLITFMIPFEVIAIPLYSLVDYLGWLDSYYGLIVPGLANGLVIFLYRQFFLDLPTPLLEAARIDGASWWRIYSRVAMPLCKPVTISASLLIFISQWESFMWPLLVSRSKAYMVIQVAMSYFVTEHATFWNEMFAASILAIIIPLCLLLPFQKYFVQGVTNTGVKE
jgi:multiple sugar transport system permease protein